MTYLLDTNIVSYILKKNVNVDKKFREARRLRKDIFISKPKSFLEALLSGHFSEIQCSHKTTY